ncbi:hypothetical protein RIF25_02015 [Thermosynechococcaceae cyanobacterium BACA0444]|uniref:Uncharacterized protein n=1 Tax=Pseudocalidococcus azoricus BACA0444 TaxID=2918990 RepID=A0AAE4JUQ8_9CYAN|nr:hypothetical protein [Pseudocalidococcus azoricus]MDS3859575.1 hypothetical protein [Pseudocalidococcus azoricus BACA0444]
MKPATRLWLYLALIPVFGVLPAIWTIRQSQVNSEPRKISRLVILLALAWAVGYGALNLGAGTTEMWPETSLLFLNSLWTSGYFLTLFWLMTRLSRNQPLSLPFFSYFAKYLP